MAPLDGRLRGAPRRKHAMECAFPTRLNFLGITFSGDGGFHLAWGSLSRNKAASPVRTKERGEGETSGDAAFSSIAQPLGRFHSSQSSRLRELLGRLGRLLLRRLLRGKPLLRENVLRLVCFSLGSALSWGRSERARLVFMDAA